MGDREGCCFGHVIAGRGVFAEGKERGQRRKKFRVKLKEGM